MTTGPSTTARPPVPAGCNFDQATGVETCVTTTSSISTIGPFSGHFAGNDTFDGFTITQICDAVEYTANVSPNRAGLRHSRVMSGS